MMEERYHATTQNRFYPDMSTVNKNITVEAKLISPPTYNKRVKHERMTKECLILNTEQVMTGLLAVTSHVLKCSEENIFYIFHQK